MKDYSFVSEKIIDGDTYTAYRSDKRQKNCIIVKNGKEQKKTKQLKVNWENPSELYK